MPWELLDHQADIGLQATGETLSEALADGVRGMLTLMVDPTTVAPRRSWSITAQGGDPGALFVNLLNNVIADVDIHGAFIHDITIDTIEESDGEWKLQGRLTGEPVDLTRHVVETEVKAATYGGLLVEESPSGWRLRCVLDL